MKSKKSGGLVLDFRAGTAPCPVRCAVLVAQPGLQTRFFPLPGKRDCKLVRGIAVSIIAVMFMAARREVDRAQRFPQIIALGRDNISVQEGS